MQYAIFYDILKIGNCRIPKERKKLYGFYIDGIHVRIPAHRSRGLLPSEE
jgi:hypothetical protein